MTVHYTINVMRSSECLPGGASDAVDVGVCILWTVQLYHPIHGREVWNVVGDSDLGERVIMTLVGLIGKTNVYKKLVICI